MNIKEIASRLNQLAVENNYEIASLPQLRKTRLGLGRVNSLLFSDQTIKTQPNKYAFHSGGRSEMQFNFGEEYIDGKPCTRYALCISFERSKSLQDPIGVLSKYADRFNQFLKLRIDHLDDFEMWYYHAGKRYGNFSVQKIKKEWIKDNTFIAIGKLINKPLDKIGNQDLLEILNGFDKLLTVYKYCVLQMVQRNSGVIEKRVARLAYNSNGWLYPSGLDGKSHTKSSKDDYEVYESVAGYGHEEWLMDTTKLIDGYHYGFLEPVRKTQDAFIGKIFDVWLYTINSKTKKRYFVGTISQLEVIDKIEAKRAHLEYERNGWLQEMKDQVVDINCDPKDISTHSGNNIFNVRYKPEFLNQVDPIELEKTNPVFNFSRYTFGHYKDDFVPKKYNSIFDANNFKSDEHGDEPELKKSIISHEPKVIEVSHYHKLISEKLKAKLRKSGLYSLVNPEAKTSQGTIVDMALIENNGTKCILEIKTYQSARASIREAFGQLMEYQHWPETKQAEKLIILTQKTADLKEAIKYVQHIRNTYNIPLFYQWFDIESETLSELY